MKSTKRVKNYWINKRGINSFNYYNFIKEINKKYGLKYLFITNNIIESFHGKIAKYLTKGKTTGWKIIITVVVGGQYG